MTVQMLHDCVKIQTQYGHTIGSNNDVWRHNFMKSTRDYVAECSNFGDLFDYSIARCPEREAIIYGNWRITYGEFGSLINRTANYLKSKGVGIGSSVAIVSRNCPEWLILEFALYKLGAVVVKINWRLMPAEVADMLRRNSVTLTFLRPEKPAYEAELTGLCPDVEFVNISEVDGRSAIYTLAGSYSDAAVSSVDATGLDSCRLHTSGTTGHPKCVVYTHKGMLGEIHSMLSAYPYPDGQRYQYIAQLFHSAAIGAHLSLATGGTMVLKAQFVLDDYMHTLVDEKIESISVVPTVLKWILDETDKSHYDLSHLKTINYSTCPIPPVLLQRAIDKFHCSFYQSYGMTEMGSTVTVLLPEDHFKDGGKYLTSVGKPLCDASVKIIDENGNDCPAGVTGEICVKGPGHMRGYLDSPDAMATCMLDGWYRTKDMGWLDEAGYLFLDGRADDLIISGGENIYPGEITNVIMHLIDDVAEVAVYGVPDEIWGEHVKASVVLMPGSKLTADELKAYCKAHMPGFRAPKEIEFLPALPKGATGKVQINELKKRSKK